MAENNVKIKIRSVISDLTAFDMCAELIGEKNAVEAAEDDVIEMSTDALLCEKGDNIELSYKECSDMGMENTTTTLIFPKDAPNELNMIRTGENTAGFVFSDKIKRQPCSYNVAGYPMEFCVCTRSIDNRVTMKGGTLDLDYIIEVHGVKTQRNRFSVKVDELRR